MKSGGGMSFFQSYKVYGFDFSIIQNRFLGLLCVALPPRILSYFFPLAICDSFFMVGYFIGGFIFGTVADAEGRCA